MILHKGFLHFSFNEVCTFITELERQKYVWLTSRLPKSLLTKYPSEIPAPKMLLIMLISPFALGKARNYQKIDSWHYKPLCSQIVTTWNTEAFCLLSLCLPSCLLLLVYQGLFTTEFPPTFLFKSTIFSSENLHLCLSLKSPPKLFSGAFSSSSLVPRTSVRRGGQQTTRAAWTGP